jgi:hypothetical protein
MKEHSVDIHNKCIQTSTLADHSLKTSHHIELEGTNIVAKEDHYYKH